MGTQEFLFLGVCKHILFLYICLQDCESKDKTFFLVFIFFFNYCDCGIKLQSTNIGLNLIPRKGYLPLLHRSPWPSSSYRQTLDFCPPPVTRSSVINSLRARCTSVCVTGDRLHQTERQGACAKKKKKIKTKNGCQDVMYEISVIVKCSIHYQIYKAFYIECTLYRSPN